jgi:hypothetical protein
MPDSVQNQNQPIVMPQDKNVAVCSWHCAGEIIEVVKLFIPLGIIQVVEAGLSVQV